MEARRGPYLELGTANAFRLGISEAGKRDGLFDDPTPLEGNTYVLCDVFGIKKMTLANGETVKAGAPILYYRADTSKKTIDTGGTSDRIYDVYDNLPIVNLKWQEDRKKDPSKEIPRLMDPDGTYRFFYEEVCMGQATTFATFENKSFGPCTVRQAKAMKSYKHKTGVTLVEILIVVSIIAILATMVISLAARIDNQGKEQLTENTFALLNAALGEFQDYGYSYRDPDYDGFDFPLDCNGFTLDNLQTRLGNALDAIVSIDPVGEHKDNYSGSEALYFFLSRVPESRKTLGKIDGSLIVNILKDNRDIDPKNGIITVDSTKVYPLLRIIDPWGKTLRYDYYDEDDLPLDPDEARNFPVITSAGPDGAFDTDDDIESR
jgi:prepilin-type N-terminal cleavage/methylation domain-containing protein